METKLGPATPQDTPSENTETHARLDPYAPQPPTEPVGRPISPSAALPRQPCIGVFGADDRGAMAVATPPHAGLPPLAQSSKAPVSAPEEEEEDWEIIEIVGKRWVGRSREYKVRWKDTWLPMSDLGNAQRLLKEFEVQFRSRRGSKSRKAARAGKAG